MERTLFNSVANEEPIGIVVPHIERGTLEEGKLMYFAVAPSMRNKGYESALIYRGNVCLKRNRCILLYWRDKCTKRVDEGCL